MSVCSFRSERVRAGRWPLGRRLRSAGWLSVAALAASLAAGPAEDPFLRAEVQPHGPLENSAVVSARAVAAAMPTNWCVSEVRVAPNCVWWHGHVSLTMTLRGPAVQGSRGELVHLVLIDQGYRPTPSGGDFPCPYPLVAATSEFQVFLWGAPGQSWPTPAQDVVAALAGVDAATKWHDLSREEWGEAARRRASGTRQDFLAHWQDQMSRMQPFLPGVPAAATNGSPLPGRSPPESSGTSVPTSPE